MAVGVRGGKLKRPEKASKIIDFNTLPMEGKHEAEH